MVYKTNVEGVSKIGSGTIFLIHLICLTYLFDTPAGEPVLIHLADYADIFRIVNLTPMLFAYESLGVHLLYGKNALIAAVSNHSTSLLWLKL